MSALTQQTLEASIQREQMASYEDNLRYVQSEIQSALDKLKAGMQEGPGGAVTLTSSEGAIFYLLLTEQLGIEHRRAAHGLHRASRPLATADAQLTRPKPNLPIPE